MKKIPTNQVRSSERGLAGVAALIIFIAIVLVGAITAAVILDVTGSLEQQAAQTGEDASQQISSTLQVLAVTGGVSGSPSTDGLNNVSFLVSVAPGTPSLNLDDMTISATTEEERFDLVSENTPLTNPGIGADAQFNIRSIVPNDNTATVINGPQQRFNITIVDDGSNNDDDIGGTADVLTANERLEFVFTSSSGGQAFQEIRIPSTLTAFDTVSL